MSLPDTRERIEKSWNIRRALITKVLERGDTLVESLLLIPETGESITFERWKAVVVDELKKATDLFGNGEPLLSESGIVALAAITNPRRGW